MTGSVQIPHDDARCRAPTREHAIGSDRGKGDKEAEVERSEKEEAIRIADAVERDRGLGGKAGGLLKSVDLLTRTAIVTPYDLVSHLFAESPLRHGKLVLIRTNQAVEEEEEKVID